MFRSIEAVDPRPVLSLHVVTLDGAERTITAQAGDTVAMALLKAGVLPFRRTAVSGQARAPLCLMGVCFDCLVQIDGRANVQACMVEVSGGMFVRLPDGARALNLGSSPLDSGAGHA